MAMKKLLFVVIFIAAVCSIGFAQNASVSGEVEDANHQAIAGASVVLRNLKTGLERVVVTDGEGRFAFSDLGSEQYEATVAVDGFKKATRSVSVTDGKIVFVLEPATINIDVTVVSGSRQAELRESLNTTVEVVTRKDIEDTGYETVGEVLRKCRALSRVWGRTPGHPAERQASRYRASGRVRFRC